MAPKKKQQISASTPSACNCNCNCDELAAQIIALEGLVAELTARLDNPLAIILAGNAQRAAERG